MTITMDLDRMLDAVAISRRIVVLTHEGGEKGRYYHPRLISLRAGLGPVNRRCTLAHELAHAIHDDPPGHNPKHERSAWETAAQWLFHWARCGDLGSWCCPWSSPCAGCGDCGGCGGCGLACGKSVGNPVGMTSRTSRNRLPPH